MYALVEVKVKTSSKTPELNGKFTYIDISYIKFVLPANTVAYTPRSVVTYEGGFRKINNNPETYNIGDLSQGDVTLFMKDGDKIVLENDMYRYLKNNAKLHTIDFNVEFQK